MTDIHIYGEIDSSGARGTFSDMDLKAILDELQPSEPLNVHINSIGGRVDVGINIYNMLKKWQGKVTIIIDGWACSVSSVIAMSGDEIIMADTGLMMIHKPLMAISSGNATDLRKQAETLDIVETTLVNAYQNKSKLPAEQIKSMLEATSWLTAEEALSLGLIDRIEVMETQAVASLTDTMLAKLDIPADVMQKLGELKASLKQNEPKPERKEINQMNKREILNAIESVKAQYPNDNDNEIMAKHEGYSLLLQKLTEETETENKIKNLKIEDKGDLSFMENENQNALKIYSKAEPIKIDTKPEEGLTLGGIVKALVTGQTTNGAVREVIKDSVAGSVLIPESLSKMVIQEARNRSALNKSGMLTTVMNTPKVTIGKQVDLPKAHFKKESAPIEEGSLNFEGVELNAKTITSIVRLSEELAQDAQGIETLIANALAEAVALEIDKAGLAGDGVDPNPLGILNVEGIEKVTLDTPLADMTNTAEISKLVQKIKEKNIEPKTLIMNATNEGAIDRMTNAVTGDPVKHFESYNALAKVVSNQVEDVAIVGDFERGLLMGVLKNITIEATNKDEKSWNNLEKSVRVHARVAFAVLDKKAFAILEGTQGA